MRLLVSHPGSGSARKRSTPTASRVSSGYWKSTDASLSIVVPTMGRSSLGKALQSIALQLGPEDEVLVVADVDHDQLQARKIFEVFEDERWKFGWCESTYGRGGAQRELGIAMSTGTHLCFMDDDDWYLPGALSAMRSMASEVPVIFRMDCPWNGIVWNRKTVDYGNIGTPMFVVPNRPGYLGSWTPFEGIHGSDFTFISGCVERLGEPLWRTEIVAFVGRRLRDEPALRSLLRTRRTPMILARPVRLEK
jgi:glycosyltransferase involved in cell wall biosynthesis